MKTVTLIACSVLSAIPVAAQSRSVDPVTGDYVVRYFSEDLRKDTIVRFASPARVSPVVTVDSIVPAGFSFRYFFRIANSPTSSAPQAIMNVEVPCSVSSTTLAPPGWNTWAEPDGGISDNGPFCKYMHTTGIAPGDEATGFVIEATRLPDVRIISARSPRPRIEWPDRSEHEENVHALIEEIIWVGGEWAHAFAPTPSLYPDSVTVRLLRSQVDTMCGGLQWLNDADLCSEIQGLLVIAESEVERGAHSAAASVVAEFAARIEEQPSMPANAYWLLKINAAQVRQNLEPSG